MEQRRCGFVCEDGRAASGQVVTSAAPCCYIRRRRQRRPGEPEMATTQQAAPALLPLLLLLASVLQGRAQQFPLPYVYSDELGLGGEEGSRAAQGPQGFGPAFFLPSPFAPPRQLDPFGPPPPGQQSQPPTSQNQAQQPAQPPASASADGPPPLPPLPPAPQPQQFPPGLQFTPWSQLAQLPPFPQWPAGWLPQVPPGGFFPPQLPPGWPTSASGQPLSAIPILSPVPHGFIPVSSGPILPSGLQQFSQQQQPQQQASGGRAADSDHVDRPRTSYLSEPVHAFKTGAPTARHYHRPFTTVLLPPPTTIVLPSPLPVPQPPPQPQPPQPQPHRGWWSYWPRYPWTYLPPYGIAEA